MLVIAHSCGFIQSRSRNIEARASRRKDRSRDKLKRCVGSDARDLASPLTQFFPRQARQARCIRNINKYSCLAGVLGVLFPFCGPPSSSIHPISY